MFGPLKRITPSISQIYPSFRDEPMKTGALWLKGKQKDDGAEGLWRIHDYLYDLTDYLNKHPGGANWLLMTKGTDITELFESYHVSEVPETVLKGYYVRKATLPRNYKFTFKENGFYRTLKKRVRQKMPTVDRQPEQYSKLIFDSLFAATLLLAVIAARSQSLLWTVLTGIALSYLIGATHNFVHKKYDWRIRVGNMAFMGFRDWQIVHILSHHPYPNSLHDLEVSYYEPYFVWTVCSRMKNGLQRYVSWVYSPVIFVMIFFSQALRRLYLHLLTESPEFDLVDVSFSFLLPTVMFIGGCSLYTATKFWILILMMSGLHFSVVILLSMHHNDLTHHEGDSVSSLDWGEYQISTIIECAEFNTCLGTTLTHFGDHTLHHLFPALDVAILPQLKGILVETCREFRVRLETRHWSRLAIGQYRQLARVKPRRMMNGSLNHFIS